MNRAGTSPKSSALPRATFIALVGLMAAVLVLVTACGSSSNGGGGSSPATSAPATAASPAAPASAGAGGGSTVEINNFMFMPMALTVAVGTTVTWKFDDSTDHTVTADDNSFKSAALGNGQTYTHTFSAAGTVKYHCSIHPFMTGTIVVQ